MNEISAIFLKTGSSEDTYVVKDAKVRSYALSSEDLSFGLVSSEGTLDLSARGRLVGSVPVSQIGSKVWVENRISSIGGYSDLSVMTLSAPEYHQMVVDGKVLSNCLYVVQDDKINAYGQQIKNLSGGTDLSDAVALWQLSSKMEDVYGKGETSSSQQIQDALNGKSDISSVPLSTSQLANDSGFIVLSDVNIPTDLSSFTNSIGYLSSVPDSFKTYDDTVSSLSANGYVTGNDLTAFYPKTSTSSDQQLQLAFGGKVDISSLYGLSDIQDPFASVNSLKDTLISVLTLLKRIIQ